MAQIKATLRHGRNAPKKNINEYPTATKVAAEANKTPRMDVSLQKFETKLKCVIIFVFVKRYSPNFPGICERWSFFQSGTKAHNEKRNIN